MAYWDFREAVEEKAAIWASEYPHVKNREDAPIGTVSNKPPEALFE